MSKGWVEDSAEYFSTFRKAIKDNLVDITKIWFIPISWLALKYIDNI